MASLFDTIRQLVAEEKYVVGQHASERLEERGIMEWQVVAGLEDGELILRQELTMRIPGQRVKRTRLIQTEKYVVAVEVEMVIPADDPSEPCYESETVQLLREIKEHAERGDVAWLTRKGKVYAAVEAA